MRTAYVAPLVGDETTENTGAHDEKIVGSDGERRGRRAQLLSGELKVRGHGRWS